MLEKLEKTIKSLLGFKPTNCGSFSPRRVSRVLELCVVPRVGLLLLIHVDQGLVLRAVGLSLFVREAGVAVRVFKSAAFLCQAGRGRTSWCCDH